MIEKFIEILNKLNLISISYANPNIEDMPLDLTPSSISNFNGGLSFTFIIIFTILILISFVIFYFYMSNKSLTQNQNMGEYLKVLERKRLGRDSYIYIVKLQNQGVLLAENASGINKILTIDDSELLKEIEVNTMNKFESVNFENFLKKESYKIDNLKKKTIRK